MSRPHQMALANHCRLSIETARPIFGHVDGLISVVLTVNSGYE